MRVSAGGVWVARTYATGICSLCFSVVLRFGVGSSSSVTSSIIACTTGSWGMRFLMVMSAICAQTLGASESSSLWVMVMGASIVRLYTSFAICGLKTFTWVVYAGSDLLAATSLCAGFAGLAGSGTDPWLASAAFAYGWIGSCSSLRTLPGLAADASFSRCGSFSLPLLVLLLSPPCPTWLD